MIDLVDIYSARAGQPDSGARNIEANFKPFFVNVAVRIVVLTINKYFEIFQLNATLLKYRLTIWWGNKGGGWGVVL